MTLQVLKGETLVAEKEFDRDIIKIGRLSSAHLCLDDEKVSRIHSVIESGADGTISIIDMGSVEGTFVNGKRVNKGTLSFGDEIRVGATLIRLMKPGAQAEALQAAAAAGDVSAPVQPTAPAAAVAGAAVAVPPPAPEDAGFEEVAEAPTEVGEVSAAPAMPQGDIVHRGPAPRVRPTTQAGKGEKGLELRLYWGDTMVEDHFIRPMKKGLFGRNRQTYLSVGNAAGVHFPMGTDVLPGPEFEVARADEAGLVVRFTKDMNVQYTQGDRTLDAAALVKERLATLDGDGYSLTVDDDGFAVIEMGKVTVEAFKASRPKPALVPFMANADYGFLNVLMAMLVIFALFIVTTLTERPQRDGFADELSGNQARIVKLMIKQQEIQQTNRFIRELNERKAERAEASAASKGEEGKAGSKAPTASNKPVRNTPKGDPNVKDQAREVMAGLFGGRGAEAALGGNVGIGGALERATGGLTGSATGTQAGVGGLGMRGTQSGGGGTGERAVIGGVGTTGRGGGQEGYGSGSGGLGGKQVVDVAITSSSPVVQGSLDPALIRQVIQQNRSKIKYCYESQLTMNPNLAGQVKVRFVIAGTGLVTSSKVEESTIGNKAVETCVAGRVGTFVFPKPKGGGIVVVAYPFIFKSAG